MKITLLEKSPGVWRLRIETQKNGERHHAYETVRGDRIAAEIRRSELLKEAEQGTWAAPDKITLGAFLQQYVAQKVALEEMGPVTEVNSLQRIRDWIAPHLGAVRLQSVTGQQLQKLYTDLLTKPGEKGKPLSTSSVASIHGSLLAPAFKAARRAKLIKVNPMEEVTPPRRGEANPKALDAAGVERLLSTATGGPLEVVLIVALGTGLRRAELCGLRWRDVDFDAATIAVEGAVVRIWRKGDASKHIRKAPKTRAGRRTVDVPPEVLDVLRPLRGIGDAPVFPNWSPGALSAAFKRLASAAGLPDAVLHGTRHTHITHLLREVGKEGAKSVSQRIGHANVRTTLEIYQGVFEEDRKKLGGLASGLFKKKGAKQ
jgi:integrase